jgi:prolyl-tRNA synthetase
MGAKFLDADGKEKNIVMGSYGIGVERIAACFIEQNSDDNGIKWNKELAPFDVHIVGINTHKDIVVSEYCENLYSQLKKENIEVLYDDRDVSPGFKFKDADLIGIPIQLIIGSRSLNDNLVEVKIRVSGEKIMINTEELLDFLKKN